MAVQSERIQQPGWHLETILRRCVASYAGQTRNNPQRNTSAGQIKTLLSHSTPVALLRCTRKRNPGLYDLAKKAQLHPRTGQQRFTLSRPRPVTLVSVWQPRGGKLMSDDTLKTLLHRGAPTPYVKTNVCCVSAGRGDNNVLIVCLEVLRRDTW